MSKKLYKKYIKPKIKSKQVPIGFFRKEDSINLLSLSPQDGNLYALNCHNVS